MDSESTYLPQGKVYVERKGYGRPMLLTRLASTVLSRLIDAHKIRATSTSLALSSGVLSVCAALHKPSRNGFQFDEWHGFGTLA
jgi:hypothetical protein